MHNSMPHVQDSMPAYQEADQYVIVHSTDDQHTEVHFEAQNDVGGNFDAG